MSTEFLYIKRNLKKSLVFGVSMNVLNIKATFELTVDHIVLKSIQLFDSTNNFDLVRMEV